MRIRRGIPEDGSAVLTLIDALAEYESLPGPRPDQKSRFLADAFADHPPFELWVAENTGQVQAYAVTFTTYSTFRAQRTLFLEDLFVHPDARRRGIGSQMMRFLRDLAASRGCGRFEWMVLDWNHDAQSFYRKFGADLEDSWRLCRMSFADRAQS